MSGGPENKLKVITPTVLVVFGITGDLSRRKLLAAIFDLYTKGLLPDQFRLVGFSRRELSKAEIDQLVRSVIQSGKKRVKSSELKSFLKQVSYVAGNFDDLSGYQKLASHLQDIDRSVGLCTNKLLYLAVPPTFYPDIFRLLKKSRLNLSCLEKGDKQLESPGWTRVLVEKPFGRDTTTARRLDRQLSTIFAEDQIFRIDHYLAKETVQNILTFRFANSIFENLWSRKYISHVNLRMLESLDLVGRGSFYDSVGAIRDVGQNHLLQMLGVVAMERPKNLSAKYVRLNRARVLDRLITPDKKYVKNNVWRGQYQGFRGDSGVAAKSETETYFKIKAFIDNRRWRGVPFYLESGKAMDDSYTDITIYFRDDFDCLCPLGDHNHVNSLTFTMRPKEGIEVKFWAKKPGFGYDVGPRALSFVYGQEPEDRIIPDAYEKLLHDALMGDQTLFPSTDEVDSAWRFITPILKNLKSLPLKSYPKGSKVEDF